MLNKNLEKFIFIVLFVLIFLISGFFATQIKINDLEINIGKTPEQVIEEAYPEIDDKEREYKYVTIDDFLFVCIESETRYSEMHFAYKTNNSGYIFNVPGMSVNAHMFHRKHGIIQLAEREWLHYFIYHVRSKYLVEITDAFGKSNIQLYDNQTPIKALTFDNALNQHWAVVIPDLETHHNISFVYEGKEYPVTDTEKIKSFFGA